MVLNPEPAASHANLMLWSGQRTPAQANPSADDFVEDEVRYQPHQAGREPWADPYCTRPRVRRRKAVSKFTSSGRISWMRS